MKIVKKMSKSRIGRNCRFLALLLVALFLLGLWVGQVDLSGGAAAVKAQVERWQRQSREADLPVLLMEIGAAEYDALLAQRQAAPDFVPATIDFAGERIPVEMRLGQGTAVPLSKDEKWNYEVFAQDNQTAAGMQAFQLLDPADNNWLNDWAFAESLRREGVVAGRVQFVRLLVNGDDKGIYALQEGAGSALKAVYEQPVGVIVAFDPTRLWPSLADFQEDETAINQNLVTLFSVDEFRFFEVDASQETAVSDDAMVAAHKEAAIALLHGWQQGKLTASEVFDVEKQGRFLALTDLWGAADALSLLNLRYYYNPESNRLEPVVFNSGALASAGRLKLAAAYADPTLQAAYMQAAARVSQPDYLAQLQADLEPEWRRWQDAVRGEYAAQPPWAQLAARQAQMQRSLTPLQPVFAVLGPPALAQEGVIQVDVANVLNVPLELLGFDVGGATFLEADPAWIQGETGAYEAENGRLLLLPASSPQSQVAYTRFHLPLSQIIAQDAELDFTHELDINIATRLVGQEKSQLTAARGGGNDQWTVSSEQ